MPDNRIPRWRAELTLDARAELGEGPVWNAEARVLLWVDISSGSLHRFDPRAATDSVSRIGRSLAAVAPRRSGGLVLAIREGFALLDDNAAIRIVAPLNQHDASIRMNDGACDSRGRFWAGSLHTGNIPGAGALYCLDPELHAKRVLDNVTISNGVGWSPDETVMYYVDSITNGVDAFDFDAATGAIENRRRVISIDAADGLPDGLTVDSEGCIWVALWDGWSVHRYRPSGELVGVVGVPAARVTSCAFGGDDLNDLYITTATPPASVPRPKREEHGGGVFHAEPGMRGLASHLFGG